LVDNKRVIQIKFEVAVGVRTTLHEDRIGLTEAAPMWHQELEPEILELDFLLLDVLVMVT
jgi:hypothetical protein